MATSVTQYGITWTFDKPHQVGQFITGDWWVVGPVNVVSVTPTPGPASAEEPITDVRSFYNAPALHDDKTLRNGSMIILGPDPKWGFNIQGYDSRARNFDPTQTIQFPHLLPAGQSLISTISSENYVDGKLTTPYIPGALMSEIKQTKKEPGVSEVALDTAAILTSLAEVPPADAFRPAYAGTDKTIYRAKDIQWDLLPNLPPITSTPDWEKMARIYERPWLDHVSSWIIQYTAPGRNQPAYGCDVLKMNGYASLLLLTDAPREQKEKLLTRFLQYGIDLHGLALSGRQWVSDGGHWIGRKWPILFASLMLDKPELSRFPKISSFPPPYEFKLDPDAEGAEPTTLFSEDMDTYYGQGGNGQQVLWQVVYHGRPRAPYQEKPYSAWDDQEKFQNNYMWTTGNWSSHALAALYMKAKALWNHDAFFDFCDWFMEPGQVSHETKTGELKPTRRYTDKFVQQMWDTYRKDAPTQADGKDNLQWVWNSDHKGSFIQNSKPEKRTP